MRTHSESAQKRSRRLWLVLRPPTFPVPRHRLPGAPALSAIIVLLVLCSPLLVQSLASGSDSASALQTRVSASDPDRRVAGAAPIGYPESYDALRNLTAGTAFSAGDRSLRPAFSVRHDPGMNSFSFSVRHENTASSGEKVVVGFDRFSDRDNPNGGELVLSNTQLVGSRWSSLLQYRYGQDLREATASLNHLFSDDPAAWAASVMADYSRSSPLQFEDGAFVQLGQVNQQRFIAWAALSSGTSLKLQPAVAYVRTRRSSDMIPVFATDNLDLLVASLSILHREYRSAAFLDNFGRPESLPVGLQAGVGYGIDFSPRPLHDIRFMQLFGRVSCAAGAKLYASCQASLESYFVDYAPGPSLVSFQSLTYWKILRNQTLAVRLKGVIGSRLDPLTILYLGSSSGLRGYENYEFAGQRLLLVNLEHRIFGGPRIFLFKTGVALFSDSGVAWFEPEDPSRLRFHSSAGVGLRLENVKSGSASVFRLDAAYNFDRRRISFVLSSDLLFRALSGMEFVEPVPGRTTLN